MNSYEARKATSMYWYNKSSDLRASAAALWVSKEHDIATRIVETCDLGVGFSMDVAAGPVFAMLSGMAMELMFKAIIVERNAIVNESTHDLLSLLAQTGLSFTSTERNLLKVLSHEIIWAGRYPVPKKESQMEDYSSLVRKTLFEPIRTGRITILRSNGALGWVSFNKLWSTAADEYVKIKNLA